jgi:hypothetical protein
MGLGVCGRRLCGGNLPLQGSERHPDSVEVVLQLTHLAGGVKGVLVGLVCRVDKLAELPTVIQGRR